MNPDRSCLIISGAPTRAPASVRLPRADYVIACDLGYGYARRLSVRPDLIIGDFDSYDGVLPADVPVVRLPVHKDDTDTGYALRHAVEQGYGDIYVAFALGGRLDHTLANLQSAADAAQKGARVTLSGDDTLVYVVGGGRLQLFVEEEQALSVLALTDTATDVCIEGAEYTLEGATLDNRYPLGVSNQAAGVVTISHKSGVLAVTLCAK